MVPVNKQQLKLKSGAKTKVYNNAGIVQHGSSAHEPAARPAGARALLNAQNAHANTQTFVLLMLRFTT